MAQSHEARENLAQARERAHEPNGAQLVPRDERAPVAQWVGMFLAPATFAVHLQVTYNVIPWACVRGGDVWVHVLDIAAVLLALLGTIVAWRVWQRTGRDAPGEGGGSLPRTSFLAVCGLGFSATVTLVLFGQWITAFYISPCQ
jgi:hypothetical protein